MSDDIDDLKRLLSAATILTLSNSKINLKQNKAFFLLTKLSIDLSRNDIDAADEHINNLSELLQSITEDLNLNLEIYNESLEEQP